MKTSAPRVQPLARSARPVYSTVAWLPCLLIAALGCGTTGGPQPPSLHLPTPPADLAITRVGDTVQLHWTMPRRSTDRVRLDGDQRVVICRALPAQPCSRAGTQLLRAGQAAGFTDTLPPDLITGPPRLLTYTVLLQNHNGQGAGPSNAAFTTAGAPPPRIDGLRADAESRGIVLRWNAGPVQKTVAAASDGVPVERVVRLHRTRILGPGESVKPGTQEVQAGVPQPLEQTLEVPDGPAAAVTLASGWSLDHAIDHDAALNRTYRYTVEQVARLTLGKHAIEVSSEPSEAVTVVARDVFPPAVPQSLEAVADPNVAAIDLSWAPDADPDLAGYIVYRRAAGSSSAPVRVSGTGLVANAAWRDPSPQPGARYAYSVSAVDSSGNQSERSAEAEETASLPPPGTPAGPR